MPYPCLQVRSRSTTPFTSSWIPRKSDPTQTGEPEAGTEPTCSQQPCRHPAPHSAHGGQVLPQLWSCDHTTWTDRPGNSISHAVGRLWAWLQPGAHQQAWGRGAPRALPLPRRLTHAGLSREEGCAIPGSPRRRHLVGACGHRLPLTLQLLCTRSGSEFPS